MEVLQVPSELERAKALYAKVKPKRVLEIGCWDGGTLREWLQATPAPQLVVAVSLEHRQPEAYPGWTQDGTQLVVGTGDSTSQDMVDLIREHAPYDWAFIDGEHAYPYARHDAEVVLPLMRKGGAMLLHDVTPPAGEAMYGPLQVLQELEAAGAKTEIYDVPERYPWSAGIGVVYT
jgi:predicted O-methyltransferase YrrM